LARGTGTKSPIAPSQNPRKFRSYESILATLGMSSGFLFDFLSRPCAYKQPEGYHAGGFGEGGADLDSLALFRQWLKCRSLTSSALPDSSICIPASAGIRKYR